MNYLHVDSVREKDFGFGGWQQHPASYTIVRETMGERPGIRTTEFWVTLIIAVAGALPTFGLPDEHVAVKVAGFAVAVLAALGYTLSRTKVKQADLKKLPVYEMVVGQPEDDEDDEAVEVLEDDGDDDEL